MYQIPYVKPFSNIEKEGEKLFLSEIAICCLLTYQQGLHSFWKFRNQIGFSKRDAGKAVRLHFHCVDKLFPW